MPTAISGAIGTARQFTPQPDAGYVGRYAGVSPSSINASFNRSEQLSQNMMQLSAALSSYRVSHESYMNDMGSIEAQRMIQGESEESIRKLNAIDAAQQEGFADSLSNPYFKANAERLRGGFLSTVMKNQYDEKYALTPARTAQEEANRYNQFAKDWQKENLEGDSAPVNMTAFSTGFNENQLINMGNLMATWEKKNYENEVTTTMASVQSQLGDVIKEAPELLKSNGLVTQRVQEIFNNVRLMGLPAQYRAKLLNDFAEEFIKTGHIDGTRLSQMMDNITIQTNFDGTEMKASQLLDMMSFKTMASEYSAQFHTQEKYDWVEAQRKTGSLKGALAEIAEWRQTDPEKAREYNKLIPTIKAGIEHDEAERAAEMRRRMAATGRTRSGGGNRSITDPAAASDIISAWVNGNDIVNGLPVKTYTIDKDILYGTALPLLQRFVGEGNWDSTYRLMDMPQLSGMRESFSTSLANILSSIMPTDDGGVNIGNNEQIRSFVGGIINNPAAVANTFGGDLAREAYTLKTLITSFGGGDTGMQQGLRLYAEAHQTARLNPDVHKANAEAAEDHMLGFTIDNVPSANGSTDWADFGLSANQFVANDIQKFWTTLYDANYDPERALSAVNEMVRQNYETYHWGVYPKDVHYNIGTDNDAYWFKQALNSYIYKTCGDGASTVDYETTTIGYNSGTRIFTFTCNNRGEMRQITLSQLHKEARTLYQNRDTNTETSLADDSSVDIDDINQQRADSYYTKWNTEID